MSDLSPESFGLSTEKPDSKKASGSLSAADFGIDKPAKKPVPHEKPKAPPVPPKEKRINPMLQNALAQSGMSAADIPRIRQQGVVKASQEASARNQRATAQKDIDAEKARIKQLGPLGYAGSGAGLNTPPVMSQIVHANPIAETISRVSGISTHDAVRIIDGQTGIAGTGLKFLEMMTDPTNVAIMMAVPGLSPPIRRMVTAAFTVQMAHGTMQQAKQLDPKMWQRIRKGQLSLDDQKQLTMLLGQSGMTLLAGLHASGAGEMVGKHIEERRTADIAKDRQYQKKAVEALRPTKIDAPKVKPRVRVTAAMTRTPEPATAAPTKPVEVPVEPNVPDSAPTPKEPVKTEVKPDAVQKQGAAPSVLRTEQPEVGLPKVGSTHPEKEVPAGEGEAQKGKEEKVGLPDTHTGVRKAHTEEVQKRLKLDDTEMQVYDTIGTAYPRGRNAVEEKRINPETLVRDLLDKPRTTKPEETGALGYYMHSLNKDLIAHDRVVADAIKSGDRSQLERAQQDRQVVVDKIKDAIDAKNRAGREASAALQAFKTVVDGSGDLDEVLTHARNTRGKALDARSEASYTQLVKERDEAQASAAKLREEHDKLQKEAAAAKPEKKPTVRQGRTARTQDPTSKDFGGKNTVFGSDRLDAARQVITRNKPGIGAGGNPKTRGAISLESADPLRRVNKENQGAYEDIAGYYIEGGLRTFKQVAEAMLTEDPKMTDEDLRDVWNGARERIRGEKQLVKLQKQIDAQEIAKTPLQKRQESAELADIRRQLKLKRTERNLVIWLKKAGQDLAGKQPEPPKGATVTSPRIESLKRDLAAVQKELALDRSKATADQRIVKLKTQLETGVTPPAKAKVAVDKELAEHRLAASDLSKQIRAKNDLLQMAEEIKSGVRANKPAATPQEMSRELQALLGEKKLLAGKRNDMRKLAEVKAHVADMEEQLRTHNLKAPKDRTPAVVSEELKAARIKAAGLQRRIQMQMNSEQPLTPAEKALATFKAFKLSGYMVFAKLGGATAWTMPVEGLADLFGAVGGRLPAGKGRLQLRDVASREGQFNPITDVKALGKALPKVPTDMRDTLMHHMDRIDAEAQRISHRDTGLLDTPGKLHGATKSLLKRQQYEKAVMQRMRQAAKLGQDISNPEVQARIGFAAANDAINSILMGDNRLAEAGSGLISQLQRAQPKGTTPGARVAASSVRFTGHFLRSLVPIVRVSANYLGKAVDMTGAGLIRGGIEHRMALNEAKATGEPIPAEVADSIIRAYKYGGLGLVTAYIGLNQPAAFRSSGLYNIDKKYNKDSQGKPLDPDSIELFNHKMPVILSHSPFVLAVQYWASVRNRLDRQAEEYRGKAIGNAMEALPGMTAQVPGMETFADVTRVMSDKDRTPGKTIGTLVAGDVIPQAAAQAAKLIDRKPREVKGFTDTLQERIPGLRQRLPERKTGLEKKMEDRVKRIQKRSMPK